LDKPACHSAMKKIRVLVADDSALMRQTLKRIIADWSDFDLVGLARDGEDAILKARELRPDVISMDINMPKMDGVTALQTILHEKICPVVMVSSLTQQGATTTFECQERGREHRKPQSPPARAAFAKTTRRRAIALGISTGGPATLHDMLPQIPADLPASMFLVQHMPPAFIASFAARLNDSCQLKVVEARSGMSVETSVCYVAPGGMHLCLHRKLTGEVVIRTPTTPPTLFVPSVGVMMASVLAVYGADTIGVLMTGIGDDGADQMVAIKQAGGHTIAESEQTAVVYGMPREAIERGGACVVSPSHDVAREIMKAIRRTNE